MIKLKKFFAVLLGMIITILGAGIVIGVSAIAAEQLSSDWWEICLLLTVGFFMWFEIGYAIAKSGGVDE